MEFRAGKMLMEGKKVIPDSRKGLVRIGRVWEKKSYLIWFIIFLAHPSLRPRLVYMVVILQNVA